MMRLNSLLQRSLFLQVSLILATSLFLFIVLMQFMLQTSLVFRLFPSVMERHARATSELVFLLENNTEDSITPILLSSFSSASRKALTRESFPETSTRSKILGRPFVTKVPSQYFIGERDIRFRMVGVRELYKINERDNLKPITAISALEVSVRMEDGSILSVLSSPVAIFGASSSALLMFAIGLSLLTSILGIRLAFRPLHRLETAAHSVGLTSKPFIVEEEGTEDLRRVTRALNNMQVRVQGLLADRSKMLAALAHDIRTGLTHVKLRLDQVDAETAPLIMDDVEHMERLISDMLLYARAEQPTTEPELVDICSFLREFAGALPYSITTDLGSEQFLTAADPNALKRAFSNIIDNAHIYADSITLRSHLDEHGLNIFVDDLGPGIPEDDLARIFDPFYRVEPSRNRNTGGSGLGLTIARALLSAHGATLTLFNREGKGLTAHIRFPSTQRVD
ncbi:MAG: ATP-binding protein [Pseudomonadota bacterium]